jgi:hypothetical protein
MSATLLESMPVLLDVRDIGRWLKSNWRGRMITADDLLSLSARGATARLISWWSSYCASSSTTTRCPRRFVRAREVPERPMECFDDPIWWRLLWKRVGYVENGPDVGHHGRWPHQVSRPFRSSATARIGGTVVLRPDKTIEVHVWRR